MTLTNSEIYWPQLSHIAAGYIGDLQNSTSPIGSSSAIYNQMAQINVYGTSTPIGLSTLSNKMTPYVFNSSRTYDLVTFVNNLYLNVYGYPDTSTIPASAYDPSNPASPLNGLYKAFLYISGINNPDNPDLSIIQTSNLPGQFSALFTDFIKQFSFSVLSVADMPGTVPDVTVNGTTYQISNNAGVYYNYPNFYTQFLSYMTTTTAIQNSSKTFI